MALTFTSLLGGKSLSKTVTKTGSLETVLDESVADAQTDVQINVAIDVTAVKEFYLVSDQDVTLETNSGSTPDDTLSLVANEPYVWHSTSLDSFLLTVDVTAFFITNASGSVANIDGHWVVDATP